MRRTTRAPTQLNWQLMQRTALTIELSERGLDSMPTALAERRIIVALHEAAHFVASVQYNVPVLRVGVLGTRGQRPEAGALGVIVFGTNQDSDGFINECRALQAGSVHDRIMLRGGESHALLHDWVSGYICLARHAHENGMELEKFGDLLRTERQEVIKFLHGRWEAVRTLACAFLVYSNPVGVVRGPIITALCNAVRRELQAPSSYSDYGTPELFAMAQRCSARSEAQMDKFATKVATWGERELVQQGLAAYA